MQYPLTKLPKHMDTVLFLIREELKSRKLFRILHKAGFDNGHYQPCLDSLILESIGIERLNDETLTAYTTILEKRSRRISEDGESVMKQALKVYQELQELRG